MENINIMWVTELSFLQRKFEYLLQKFTQQQINIEKWEMGYQAIINIQIYTLQYSILDREKTEKIKHANKLFVEKQVALQF